MRRRLCALTCAIPLLITGCVDDDRAAAPSPAPSSPATAEPSPSPSPAPAPSAAPPQEGPGEPEQAALTFVRAVAEGRSDDAYALLADRSREQVGGPDGFRSVRTALAEGFGAFAAAEPRLLRVELDDGGVLTLAGEVTREGMTEYGTATLPYRDEDGEVLLDPFGRATGQAEFVSPVRDGAVAPGAELEVAVPAAANALLAVDGTPLDTSSRPDGERQRLTATAPDDLQVDRVYVLTAVWVDDDGGIGSDAVAFTAG